MFPRTWRKEWVAEDQRNCRDYLDHNTAKITKNILKNNGELKKIVYTQTPVKNH